MKLTPMDVMKLLKQWKGDNTSQHRLDKVIEFIAANSNRSKAFSAFLKKGGAKM